VGPEIANASIKMIGSLLLILGLIACLFYLFKRFRFGSFSQKNVPRMRLIGTLNLAPKRGLALVEIRDQWLLVGVGTENVTLISSLERPEEAEEAVARPAASFSSVLRKTGVKETPENTSS
jgi:flagellar protein FliO/FliZ